MSHGFQDGLASLCSPSDKFIFLGFHCAARSLNAALDAASKCSSMVACSVNQTLLSYYSIHNVVLPSNIKFHHSETVRCTMVCKLIFAMLHCATIKARCAVSSQPRRSAFAGWYKRWRPKASSAGKHLCQAGGNLIQIQKELKTGSYLAAATEHNNSRKRFSKTHTIISY